MRVGRSAQNLVIGALVLGASFVTGCKSYHYFDVDVTFPLGEFTLANAGMIQLCTLVVSGADNGSFNFPDNNTNREGGPICPVQQNYPDLGTFEYTTFEDSGTLHFVVSAYSMDTTPPLQSSCFAAGSADIGATDEITTPGKISLSMTTSGCVQ